jgi:23S rRNA (uracil1939-C5)-methyltransferase
MKPAGGLAPGDRIEVEVEKAVYRGLGLARHDGQVIFVPRGLPGERLAVRIESVERGYARATAEERRREAPTARASPCPAFPRCGGCAYQSVDYGTQLTIKADLLRESLRRAGVAWDRDLPVTPSPEDGWRTRAAFHVARESDGIAIGFFEEGTRRIVDLGEGCPQVSRGLRDLLLEVRGVLRDRPSLARSVAHLRLAESNDGADCVLLLEGDLVPAEAAYLAGALASPRLTGIGALLGREGGGRLVSLSGSPYVHSDVLGVRLRSHAGAFFQGNRFLVTPLAREVRRLAAGKGPLLDLYAGAGLFALTSEPGSGPVFVVEGSDLSAADAEENARSAGASQVRVRRGDVAEVLPALRKDGPERIILDPPRAGLSKPVVEAIGARRPEAVVYVSCDPSTLGRDLRRLASFGLEADSMQLFDMFPDTYHVETVTRLVPR